MQLFIDVDREFSEQDTNVEPKETVTSQVAATAHASTSASTDGNSEREEVKRIRKSRKRTVQTSSKAGAKSSSTVQQSNSKLAGRC